MSSRPTLTSFASWCRQLSLESGKPFRLLKFQRLMLRDYFRGARETVIILPKKNGKTSLMAALALYHLVTVADAEVVIGAASRDQASILFKQAAGLVQRSGLDDTFDVRPGYREIRIATDERHDVPARIRVLAADSATADGVIPTLALVDELHRHKSAELYGVFRDGLGPRKGQLITISTAGATMESPLGELRSKAHALEGFTRTGVYNHAESADRSFVLHEWCLEAEQDTADIGLVKQANPAPWHTPEALAERHSSPSTTDTQWARFACGIWMDSANPYISAEEWMGRTDELPDLSGRGCFGGLDLSATTDTTAFTLVFPAGDEIAVRSFVFIPAEGLVRRIERDHAPYDQWLREGHLVVTPGGVVDYAFVKATILEAARDYNLRQIGYDRWNSSQLVSELMEEGLDMVPIGQGFRDMAQPMQDLRRLVLARRIVHGSNPVLRRHISSMSTAQDPAGNLKPAKNRSSGRIDAAVALLMALAVASKGSEPSASVYSEQLCRCPRREPIPHLWRSGCLPRQVAV